MIHPASELRFISPEIGYGVFATELIPRGTITWTLCRFDLKFTRADLADLPPAYLPIIDKYAYPDEEGRYVLCWDHGRYVNHSCDPVMLGVGQNFEIAVRDIAPGEEITCDYGSLNLLTEMPCCCGAADCRGAIDGADVLKRYAELDARVAMTLPFARTVPQPLLSFTSEAELFWAWVDGRQPVPSHRCYYTPELA